VKFLRNSMKVAKWEIKRNMKNKTFLIGLFLTPILIVAFMFIGSLFNDDSEDLTTEQVTVLVNDQLNTFDSLEETINQTALNLELKKTDISEGDAQDALIGSENTAYIFIDQRALEQGIVPVYTSEEINPYFMDQIQVFETPLKSIQLENLGLTDEQLVMISSNISFEKVVSGDRDSGTENNSEESSGPPLEKIIPGIFAGFVMLSIVFTGMAIFQSASQEKKDKIAEIILSSLTPGELMNGKIIGYFVLGLIQTVVSIAILLPAAIWKIDFPFMEYLFVPELALYLFIAILGYLLFAAIFVGVGATMADISTAGNFQGFVMMLPFATFIFIGPVLGDPSGLWAQVGTYIPFTSPGVLLLRLVLLDHWPWLEIIIALAILLVSIVLFMKLAGKIFKVGILLYGKNASVKEIWKWIRA